MMNWGICITLTNIAHGLERWIETGLFFVLKCVMILINDLKGGVDKGTHYSRVPLGYKVCSPRLEHGLAGYWINQTHEMRKRQQKYGDFFSTSRTPMIMHLSCWCTIIVMLGGNNWDLYGLLAISKWGLWKRILTNDMSKGAHALFNDLLRAMMIFDKIRRDEGNIEDKNWNYRVNTLTKPNGQCFFPGFWRKVA